MSSILKRLKAKFRSYVSFARRPGQFTLMLRKITLINHAALLAHAKVSRSTVAFRAASFESLLSIQKPRALSPQRRLEGESRLATHE